ncbi:hypothetical protein [Richelia sinica]|nr:hypothetical protein [Richelia sinica]
MPSARCANRSSGVAEVCLRHATRTGVSRGGFTDIINYEREFW